MAIEIICLYVLWLIAVSCISYLAWRWKYANDLQLTEADLAGQRVARREQERRYDELYDAFLRLNKYNTDLQKTIQKYKNSYEECGEEVYNLFLDGKSRKELAQLYPSVAYTTICNWIRRKQKEYAHVEDLTPSSSKQAELF